MNLTISLVLFFILFLTLFLIFRYSKYRSFSSFFMSYIISVIFLLIIYPPTNDELSEVIDSKTSIYFLILILGFFIFWIYALTMALTDYDIDVIKERESFFMKPVIV